VRDAWHLRQCDCLGALTADQHRLLRAAAQVRSYRKKEAIFSPDPVPRSIYLLEKGLVRIFRISRSGNEVTLGYVAKGEVFGELAAVDHLPRESHAEAVRPSTVWRIPRDEFKRLISTNEALSRCLTLRISSRLKKIEMRIEDLVFRDVRARVARMLLELAGQFGRPLAPGSGIQIEVDLTQTDLAMLIGATRQTLNAKLRALEASGLIRRSGRQLVVLKPERLRQLAYDAPEDRAEAPRTPFAALPGGRRRKGEGHRAPLT
jgi:CRP-like cAMP-binding protein